MRLFGITIPRVLPGGRGARPPGAPRLSRRSRRISAALVAGCAAALLAWALVPASDAGTAVVVAARTVPAGQRIVDADVRIASYPPRLAPHDRVESPNDLVGRAAAHQLSAGVPLTPEAVMSPGSAALTKGNVLVPVSIPDAAAAAVLEPGHRVRVYATAEQAAAQADVADGLKADSRTLVPTAVVTAVRRPDSGGLAGDAATVVTLSVPEDRAAAVAAVASGGLGFALLN